MEEKTMGELIAALRKQQGMTQQALADKMCVTDKAVSKWERNLSCPDIKSIPHLAEVLGVSVEELMQVQQPEPTTAEKLRIGPLADTVLGGVALAMGVAVVVLNVLGQLEVQSAMTMLGLGLGLACLAAKGMK